MMQDFLRDFVLYFTPWCIAVAIVSVLISELADIQPFKTLLQSAFLAIHSFFRGGTR